ncbi:reverse transcriptase domain-containing protein [Tanacetum coccineum]
MKEELLPKNTKLWRLEERRSGITPDWNMAIQSVRSDRFHELARMVVATDPPTIQSAILKARVLTDEAVRNGSLKRRQGGNHPNKAMAIKGGSVRGKQMQSGTGRAHCAMGAEEARQDSNIVTGTFSLNNYYATMLFDSGADYSFISTTFVHFLVRHKAQ